MWEIFACPFGVMQVLERDVVEWVARRIVKTIVKKTVQEIEKNDVTRRE